MAERDARTLTVLTTEHFTLQGTRAAMTTESLGRATIYLGSLSATLVVLALVAQGTASPAEFRLFALAILPAIFFLGVATFIRIVETAIEDNIAAMAINRIRGYYLELAGEDARYFMLGLHDDRQGVLANAGLGVGLARRLDSVGTVIALINSMVGGAAASVAIEAFRRARARCRHHGWNCRHRSGRGRTLLGRASALLRCARALSAALPVRASGSAVRFGH